MKLYPFNALLARMKYIARWGLMRSSRTESVSEHTADVAILAHTLCVIAQQYFPGEAVFPVMCGTIFQQLLAAIFGRIMTRLTERERAAEVKLVRRGWASAKGHGPSSRA